MLNFFLILILYHKNKMKNTEQIFIDEFPLLLMTNDPMTRLCRQLSQEKEFVTFVVYKNGSW